MSFDLNLTTVCDHLVYREQEVMNLDQRTLFLDKPISSNSTVKVYVSDNLMPSSMYEVRNNPQSIDSEIDKIVYFKDPWKSSEDYFEVTYYTQAPYCPKCSGTKYIDDVTYDIKGNLLTQRDERLLIQNIEKFVITRINSNPFHTFIGSGLIGLIGSRISNDTFVISQIKDEISRAIQKFQDLQSQYQMAGRVVTSGEMLASVEDITVVQDVNIPTMFRANVTVTAQSGKTVEFEQFLRLRL